jgi:very-short-patch-repair endonuclease
LHLLLWQAGIIGWTTNAWVLGYRADVLFKAARLIVEVDGWEFHRTREAFEADRWRRNELELAGYLVLNVTWRHIVEQPRWVIDCIVRGLADDRCSVVA